MTAIICGGDVSAKALDVCVHNQGQHARFENAAPGILALAAFCRRHRVELVVMEASGGHERLAFGPLWVFGLPCAIANPRSVPRFAEAMGVLKKTDRIDAEVIAWYVNAKRLAPRRPATPAQHKLQALVTRLRQLTALKTAQRNQRRLLDDADAQASIDELMALLTRQIRTLEAKLTQLIEADSLWAELDRSFRAIKGVAGRTTAHLLAHLPAIGTLSNKAAAKLTGLTPLAHDSGQRTGRCPIHAGRSPLRAILFVVAEVVRRFEPDFITFHARLTLAGKPKKTIRIALARKLLVRLNAKAREARRHPAQAT